MVRERNLGTDNEGAGSVLGGLGGSIFGIPMIFVLIVAVLAIFLLFGGWILIAFTTKTLIVVVLLGAGLFLLVKPSILSGMGEQAKIGVPIFLILLAILFYANVFTAIAHAFGG